MPQTIALAPQTAAGTSSDIVITGAPGVVFVYATGAAEITCGFQVSLHRKIGSDYEARAYAWLDNDRPALEIAPGTYRASKGITAQQIGVGLDT